MGQKDTKFEQEATRSRSNLIRELVDFLSHNKKWWMTPIILVLLLLGVFVLLGGTIAAPFIYTLF